MNREVIVRPIAQREIDSQTAYLIKHADNETAQRFLDTLFQTIKTLASMPEIGTLWIYNEPKLKKVRWHPLRGFRYLIFYKYTPTRFELIRVYHTAQHIKGRFSED